MHLHLPKIASGICSFEYPGKSPDTGCGGWLTQSDGAIILLSNDGTLSLVTCQTFGCGSNELFRYKVLQLGVLKCLVHAIVIDTTTGDLCAVEASHVQRRNNRNEIEEER